jgi:DDE superfamily endonuclease
MATIFQNVTNEKKLKATTGLNNEEFDALAAVFSKHYKPKQGNPYQPEKAPVLTDPREALFFFLHHLKAYPTLEVMGVYFNISVFAVSTYLDYMRAPFKAAVRELGCAPAGLFGSQEEFDQKFAGVEDLVVDCTEVPVQRPQDNDTQSFVYSGKKKFHTLKFLIVASLAKGILFVGLLWNGKAADVTMLRRELGGWDMGGRRVHMDLGFKGFDKEIINGEVVMPHKKAKGKKLTEEEKEYNRSVSKIRVIVENAFAGVKSFFINRIENRFHSFKKTYDAFQNTCALHNLKLKIAK